MNKIPYSARVQVIQDVIDEAKKIGIEIGFHQPVDRLGHLVVAHASIELNVLDSPEEIAATLRKTFLPNSKGVQNS